MLVRILILAIIINISLNTTKAQIPLVINELMASNSSTEPDPQDEYDDWIEIYNYGTNAIDMSGMYLSDDLANPTRWQFPDGITLYAGDYLLIWADGDATDAGLHANFKLSADGEEIGMGRQRVGGLLVPDVAECRHRVVADPRVRVLHGLEPGLHAPE